MSKKEKSFGKHVIAFHGRVNDSKMRPLIALDPEDVIDDPCLGDVWLSPAEAERLAKQLLKAAAYLRASEERAESGGG